MQAEEQGVKAHSPLAVPLALLCHRMAMRASVPSQRSAIIWPSTKCLTRAAPQTGPRASAKAKESVYKVY